MDAVITGDIVGSTSADGDRAQNKFSAIEEDLSHAFGLMKTRGWLGEGDFVSFRGDSFQCLLPVEHGLEAALMIKAALKGGVSADTGTSVPMSWSCRLVVGIGEVTHRADLVSKSNGPAFHRSGRTLDALPKSHYMDIASPWDSVNEEFDLMCRYLDIIIERLWTIVSARTVWIYFQEEYTQTEMAELLGISQSAMNQRIQGAEVAVLEQTIKRYHSIIKSYAL